MLVAIDAFTPLHAALRVLNVAAFGVDLKPCRAARRLSEGGSQGCSCRGGHVPSQSAPPPRFLRQLRLRRAK